MAEKIVVVTDRRLSEYHQLNKQQIKKDINTAINELPTASQTGNIEDMNQEEKFILYGGKAPKPEEEGEGA